MCKIKCQCWGLARMTSSKVGEGLAEEQVGDQWSLQVRGWGGGGQ